MLFNNTCNWKLPKLWINGLSKKNKLNWLSKWNCDNAQVVQARAVKVLKRWIVLVYKFATNIYQFQCCNTQGEWKERESFVTSIQLFCYYLYWNMFICSYLHSYIYIYIYIYITYIYEYKIKLQFDFRINFRSFKTNSETQLCHSKR